MLSIQSIRLLDLYKLDSNKFTSDEEVLDTINLLSEERNKVKINENKFINNIPNNKSYLIEYNLK